MIATCDVESGAHRLYFGSFHLLKRMLGCGQMRLFVTRQYYMQDELKQIEGTDYTQHIPHCIKLHCITLHL